MVFLSLSIQKKSIAQLRKKRILKLEIDFISLQKGENHFFFVTHIGSLRKNQ